jgi:hypothetical protein
MFGGALSLFKLGRSLVGIFLGMMIFASHESNAMIEPKINQEWVLVSDEDGIQVFKKEIPGSSLISFKGQGLIDAPIAKVAQILVDSKRSQEWMESVKTTTVLSHNGDLEYVDYTHVGTPFVIKDREFVTRTKIEIDSKAQSLHFDIKSVEHPNAPKTDYVRGEVLGSSFSLQAMEDGTKTYVTGEILADPKGTVPTWIVNLFQKGWPRKTIEALRHQSKKGDISEHPFFKKALSEAVL